MDTTTEPKQITLSDLLVRAKQHLIESRESVERAQADFAHAQLINTIEGAIAPHDRLTSAVIRLVFEDDISVELPLNKQLCEKLMGPISQIASEFVQQTTQHLTSKFFRKVMVVPEHYERVEDLTHDELVQAFMADEVRTTDGRVLKSRG